MSFGGPKNTTQTTKTEPWAGAMPYLLKTYASADKLVDAGTPNYYPGKTVIDQSQATKDSLAQMEAIARGGNPLNDLSQATATGIMNGSAFNQAGQQTNQKLMNGVTLDKNPAAAGVAGYLADKTKAGGLATLDLGMKYQNGALAGARDLATSDTESPAMLGFKNNIGFENAAHNLQAKTANDLTGANNPARAMLEQTANGSFLNANPYLNEAIANSNRGLVNQFNTEVAPGIDGQFAAAGRMGSGAFAAMRNKAEGSLANAMSQNANNVMMQNYSMERANMENAKNQIGALAQADVRNRLDANSSLATTSDAQQAQRLNALQGVMNAGNSGFQNKLAALGLQGQIDQNQNAAKMDAANSVNAQFNAGRQQQLAGLGLQSDVHNTAQQQKLQNAGIQLQAANQFNGTQNANIQQQLGMIGMMPQMNEQRYFDAQKLGAVGSAQDTYNDLLLQAEIARWDQNENKQWDNIARAASLYTGGGYNTATTTKPVYNDRFGQILGAATSLGGMYMMCDRRLKNVIRRIGRTDDGLPLYTFTYKDDPAQQIVIGPMADEVAASQPDAVVELENGFHAVNVERLH